MSKETKFKNALDTFKKMLFNEEEIQLMESTLTDGTIIVYEGELAVGVAVTVKSEEDEPMALPDGEYTTEDGTMFTTKGGLVESVEAGEGGEGGEEEFNADNFKTDVLTQVDEKLETFKTEFMNTLIEELFGEQPNEEFNTKFSAKVTEGTDAVRKDVAQLMDGVLETLTEMSKVQPTQPNHKEDDIAKTESGQAIERFRRFKQAKFNK